MKELSVFDIIGPNMIGPSSAHTVAALRIAKVAHQLAPQKIAKVTFVLYGAFAKEYRRYGSDRALVAGLLGMSEEDERVREAFSVAQDKQLNYEFEEGHSSPTHHPNVIEIIIEEPNGYRMSIIGASIGGGAISIDRVNGIEISLKGDYHILLVSHQDQPGLAAHITNCLGNWKVNIAYMHVYREEKGQVASTIVEADEPINNKVLEAILNHTAVQYARIIN